MDPKVKNQGYETFLYKTIQLFAYYHILLNTIMKGYKKWHDGK